MIRLFILTSILFAKIATNGQNNQTVIAFGSCNDEAKPQEMWSEILKQKPDVWIWGGDNIYSDDNEAAASVRARYQKQKSNPDYQKLIKHAAITGTWDDHDYGINDGGKFFKRKNESKKLFVDFIGFKKSDPVLSHEGIYNSLVIGKGSKKIKVINLDTRSFRDTIIKVSFIDSLTQKKLTRYETNPSGDVLGEEQWRWLAGQLDDNNAQLYIINSSIQLIAEDHRFEKWANFPLARQRFLNLIEKSKKRVLVISGDRHIAEFSRMQFSGLSYPLFDFTSSGLTHTWSEIWPEENRWRVGDLIIKKTFGLIKVDWVGAEPKVTLQIRGLSEIPYAEQVVLFNPK